MAIESINRVIKEEITQIEKRLKVLNKIIHFNSNTKAAKAAKVANVTAAPKKKHSISAEGRKRIAAASRARWAKVKKEKAAAKK